MTEIITINNQNFETKKDLYVYAKNIINNYTKDDNEIIKRENKIFQIDNDHKPFLLELIKGHRNYSNKTRDGFKDLIIIRDNTGTHLIIIDNNDTYIPISIRKCISKRRKV